MSSHILISSIFLSPLPSSSVSKVEMYPSDPSGTVINGYSFPRTASHTSSPLQLAHPSPTRGIRAITSLLRLLLLRWRI
jgi:hypothetical protein